MSKLEKWWPFKFKRGEKKVPVSVVPANEASSNQGATSLAPRLSPFQYFDQMLSQMWRDPFAGLALPAGFFGDFSPVGFTPALDVADEGGHLRISAEIPGVKPEDVKLTVDGDILTIRGEKKHEHESKENGVYRVERSFGSFVRSVPLPPEVTTDGADASFADGVLTIRFPKTEAEGTAPKRIPIHS